MKTNTLENKLRQLKEDLRLNLQVKYLGLRKEPAIGNVCHVYLATFIRPESQRPYFLETVSTLVYMDKRMRPSLTDIFLAFFSRGEITLEAFNAKKLQLLRLVFSQYDIDNICDELFYKHSDY